MSHGACLAHLQESYVDLNVERAAYVAKLLQGTSENWDEIQARNGQGVNEARKWDVNGAGGRMRCIKVW